MNLIGFWTLIRREVGRFFAVYRQTVIPGLISTTLYILVFGFTLQQRISEISGVPYTLFILPGLAFAKAGPAVILSYILAGLLCVPTALSKAELTTAMPKAGGDYF